MATGEDTIYNLLKILKEEILQELEQRLIASTNKSDEMEKLMTSKDVCIQYKISPSTLERYIRKGLKFNSSGIKTKRIFKKSEVELYFKN